MEETGSNNNCELRLYNVQSNVCKTEIVLI